MRATKTLFFIIWLLVACQAPPDPGPSCGYNDDMREWSKISRPDNAKQLRAMAKETQFAGDPDYNTEQWYELPSGEIMLCKARERYSQYHRRVVALNREWWVFDMSEDPPKIIEHDGVVIA